MFSHVMVGSGDIDRSKRFYDAVLGVLGAGEPVRNINSTGQTRLFLPSRWRKVLRERAARRAISHIGQRRHHRVQVRIARAGSQVPRHRGYQWRHVH